LSESQTVEIYLCYQLQTQTLWKCLHIHNINIVTTCNQFNKSAIQVQNTNTNINNTNADPNPNPVFTRSGAKAENRPGKLTVGLRLFFVNVIRQLDDRGGVMAYSQQNIVAYHRKLI